MAEGEFHYIEREPGGNKIIDYEDLEKMENVTQEVLTKC